MGKFSQQPTRRAALAGIGGFAAATQLGLLPGANEVNAQFFNPFIPFEQEIPLKGKAGPGMEPLDDGMRKIMDRHGIPGGALAVAKDGKLLLARGYGWANAATGEAVEPTTRFGLASLGKTFSAFAVMKLVEQGKIRLDDRVLGIIKHLRPPKDVEMDPLLEDVTVRQCLNHSGGWDRTIEGDPIYWEPQICRRFRVRPPLSAEQFLTFALSMPLNFKPGTRAVYSNVGYIILGEIIAKVSGQSYERFVIDSVLKPMGFKRAVLLSAEGKYKEGDSLRYLPGTMIPLPPMRRPMLDACGGWSASVVDLALFLTNADGSRGKPVLNEKTREMMLAPPPRPIQPLPSGAYYGLGWDSVVSSDKTFSYAKDGIHPGMHAFMKHMASGVNVAVVFNASAEFDPLDVRIATLAVQEVRKLIERSDKKFPDIDLFKDFG